MLQNKGLTHRIKNKQTNKIGKKRWKDLIQKIALPLGLWSPETKQGQWCSISVKRETLFINLRVSHALSVTQSHFKEIMIGCSPATYSSQQLPNTIHTITRLWDPKKPNSWHKSLHLREPNVLTKGTTYLSHMTWSYQAGTNLKVLSLLANLIS